MSNCLSGYQVVFLIMSACLTVGQYYKPIIGIYTQPSTLSKFPGNQYQMIAANNVKYLEMMGALTVPVFYDSSH